MSAVTNLAPSIDMILLNNILTNDIYVVAVGVHTSPGYEFRPLSCAVQMSMENKITYPLTENTKMRPQHLSGDPFCLQI